MAAVYTAPVIARHLAVALLCLLGGAGCTSRLWYENLRGNARDQCPGMLGSAQRDCLRRTQDDYATYVTKRRALKKDIEGQAESAVRQDQESEFSRWIP